MRVDSKELPYDFEDGIDRLDLIKEIEKARLEIEEKKRKFMNR